MSRRASITITGKSFTATGKAANNLFNALKEASMAKRVKPVIQVPVISSVEDADAVLAEIAARKRQIELHEISLREGVDALKAECTAKCEPHKIDITAREQALVQFALSRRNEIFKTRKSVDLTFGTFGFRASSVLKTLRKVTWEQVLNLVKERGLPAFAQKKMWTRKPCAVSILKLCPALAASWFRRTRSFMNWPRLSWPATSRGCV